MVRDGTDEDGIMGCEMMADEVDGWDGIVVDVVDVDDAGVMMVSGGGGEGCLCPPSPWRFLGNLLKKRKKREYD